MKFYKTKELLQSQVDLLREIIEYYLQGAEFYGLNAEDLKTCKELDELIAEADSITLTIQVDKYSVDEAELEKYKEED